MLSDDELRLFIERLNGCGDHSCLVHKQGGMGTNGGCRCFEKISMIKTIPLLARQMAEMARELLSLRFDKRDYEYCAKIRLDERERCARIAEKLSEDVDSSAAYVLGITIAEEIRKGES